MLETSYKCILIKNPWLLLVDTYSKRHSLPIVDLWATVIDDQVNDI